MQAVVLVVGVDHNWLKMRKEMDSSAVMEEMKTDSSHTTSCSLSLSLGQFRNAAHRLSPLLKLTNEMMEVLALGPLHQLTDEMKEER